MNVIGGRYFVFLFICYTSAVMFGFINQILKNFIYGIKICDIVYLNLKKKYDVKKIKSVFTLDLI